MNKAKDILSKIKSRTPQEERLQMYNAQGRELSFACGDGEKGVYVSSKKNLREAKIAFITKLTPKAVEKFLNNADDISGNGLFKKISNIFY